MYISCGARVMDRTLGILVLILVTSGCSSHVSQRCADTVQGRLKSLANCSLYENNIECGSFQTSTGSYMWNITSLGILEQVNISQTAKQFCLGLKYFNRSALIIKESYTLDQEMRFNSSLAVGVVTVNRTCWETQRSSLCIRDVTVLEETLELGVIKYVPDKEEFWNFESTFYGTKMDWFQLLHVQIGIYYLNSSWITNLQNTSIRDLKLSNVYCECEKEKFLLKDMANLRTLSFTNCVIQFHEDSFTGTPNLEDVRIMDCQLTSIPKFVNHLPKLKHLDISLNSINTFGFIENKILSQLHNLEYLSMAYNGISNILDKFPVLPKLTSLVLDGCGITTLKKDAFRNISLLKILLLSYNDISIIHNETFFSLRKLKYLDLRGNDLVTMPVIYFCSLLKLDLSYNHLTGFTNPSIFGTTIAHLSIGSNNISEWDDAELFSYIRNDTSKRNLFRPMRGSSVVEDNTTTILFITNNTQYHKSVYRISEDKLLNSVSKKKCVKMLDISRNEIRRFTDVMLKSMDSLDMVNLDYNPFDCSDCTIPQFQTWINTTKTKIIGVPRIVCSEPYTVKDKNITEIDFDLEACVVKIPNYWIIAGIPLGIVFPVFLVIISLIFRFRSQIVYIQHLYRIRRQKNASKNNCYFDAFVCYSGRDRRFVLKVLAPYLENCPERFKLCLHERDFVLGSHIVDNIVGAIEHSHKTILVLSPHFINSKWCNWELEMANHKMFDDDKQFLIIIQVEYIDQVKIPRHLKFYMDTRTFLTWAQDSPENVVKDMCQQLKKSLGKSIFQSSSEQAPLLAGALEI